MYDTQENLAIKTIDRLAELTSRGSALWIYVSNFSKKNDYIRFSQIILNLLEPLTKKKLSRTFTLKNKDILLVGVDVNYEDLQPILKQIAVVLQNYTGQMVFNFWKIFNLTDMKTELLNALGGGLVKEESTARILSEFEKNIQESEVRNYLVQNALVKKDMKGLSFWKNWFSVLLQDEKNLPIWLVQEYERKLLKKLFDSGVKDDNCGVQVYLKDIDFTNCQNKTFFIHIMDVIKNRALYDQLFLKSNRTYEVAVVIPGESEEYYNLDRFEYDYVVISCSKKEYVHVPKEKIIVKDVKTQDMLLRAIEDGYTLFQGDFIEILLAASRRKTCPFGRDCSLRTCFEMGKNPNQAYRCVCPSHLWNKEIIA